MGLIENILGLPSGVNRPNKSGNVKRGESKHSGRSAENAAGKTVKTDISDKARQLLSLKNEANGYVKAVKESETLSSKEIEEIQQRISSQDYFDSEVIDKVVDRLLRTVRVQRLK